MQRNILQHLQSLSLGTCLQVTPLSGGCVSQVFRVQRQTLPTLVCKWYDHRDMSCAEAAGLRALKDAGLYVPDIVHVDERCLLLQDMQSEGRSQASDFWTSLASQLAHMHQIVQPTFGFDVDTFCGSTRQPNQPATDGYAFYAQQRYWHQAEHALQQGLLTTQDGDALQWLLVRLPELIPEQAPVLLHGDLWSGNVIHDQTGRPIVIDPACYWGWAEADLAMTVLFGGFPPSFYQTYLECHPLSPGWQQRAELYNLYHLLNHLNMFGQSYYAQVMAILRHY